MSIENRISVCDVFFQSRQNWTKMPKIWSCHPALEILPKIGSLHHIPGNIANILLWIPVRKKCKNLLLPIQYDIQLVTFDETNAILLYFDSLSILVKFRVENDLYVLTRVFSFGHSEITYFGLSTISDPKPGLPDLSWLNVPKRGKIYQIITTLPNGHKVYQMTVKYSKWP
jgi:hypothetical protein